MTENEYGAGCVILAGACRLARLSFATRVNNDKNQRGKESRNANTGKLHIKYTEGPGIKDSRDPRYLNRNISD